MTAPAGVPYGSLGIIIENQTPTGAAGVALNDNFSILNDAVEALQAVSPITSATAPLVDTAGVISIPKATSSVDGYLNHSDWTTFNNKQNTISATLPLVDTAGVISLNYDNSTIKVNGSNQIYAVGTGTVTSVAMTGDGTIFSSSVSGSPITTSGTLAPSLSNQTAHKFLVGPASGSPAAPTFRSLVPLDFGSSPAIGAGTTSSGSYSIGILGTASGNNSLAIGQLSSATHASCNAIGAGAVNQGLLSNIFGAGTIGSSSAYCNAVGNNITTSGNYNQFLGNYCDDGGFTSVVMLGSSITASTTTATANNQFWLMTGLFCTYSSNLIDFTTGGNALQCANINQALSTANTIGTAAHSTFYGIGTNLTALNASNLTSGTVAVARLPVVTNGGSHTAGIAPDPGSGSGTTHYLREDSTWAVPPVGTGTVTSVAMTGDGTIFNSSVTGSPVTTSGTLAPSLHTQSQNLIFAGPASGSAAAPTFRALVPLDYGRALGSGATAAGTNSLAVGVNSAGTANLSTCIGYTATSSGTYAKQSVAVGCSSSASGGYSIAIGNSASSTNNQTVAIGSSSQATNSSSVAIGGNTTASGAYSSAFGADSTASGSRSTAFGLSAVASAAYSSALGPSCSSSGAYDVIIGNHLNAGASHFTPVVMIGNTSTTPVPATAANQFWLMGQLFCTFVSNTIDFGSNTLKISGAATFTGTLAAAVAAGKSVNNGLIMN